jgi:hypothetical protein
MRTIVDFAERIERTMMVCMIPGDARDVPFSYYSRINTAYMSHMTFGSYPIHEIETFPNHSAHLATMTSVSVL